MTTTPHPQAASDLRTDDAVPILYTNWRGETAVRRITPLSLKHDSSEWHPEPQWLLKAFDLDKEVWRDFAVSDIKAWGADAVETARARGQEPNEGTEWFWRIVDANGLGNVPSDEVAALRLLCERAALARPAPDATPAGADVEGLRKVAKWLEQRMDAAEGDRDAHPKDHALNRFYGGQAIAYENALSLVLNTARELKTVLAPPASAADGEGLKEAIFNTIHNGNRLGQATEITASAVWDLLFDYALPTTPPPVPPTRVAGLDREAVKQQIISNVGSGVYGDLEGVDAAADAILALAPTPGETPGQDAVADALAAIKARTYSSDRGCSLKADAVAEIHEIVRTALASLRPTQADTGGESQSPAPAGDAVEAQAVVRGLLSEAADAIFAISPTAPSEAQIDRARTAAERLLDSRDDITRAALAAIAQGPGAGQAVPDGWKLVPDKATRGWAERMANIRQGQRSEPRCEPPGEADIDWCLGHIKTVIAAAPLPAAPATAASEGDARLYERQMRDDAHRDLEEGDMPGGFN